jgi:hypothetical protein
MPLITGTSYVASIDWQAAELRVYIRAAANCFPSGRPTTHGREHLRSKWSEITRRFRAVLVVPAVGLPPVGC